LTGSIGGPETSDLNHLAPRDNPGEGRINLIRGGSLKLTFVFILDGNVACSQGTAVVSYKWSAGGTFGGRGTVKAQVLETLVGGGGFTNGTQDAKCSVITMPRRFGKVNKPTKRGVGLPTVLCADGHLPCPDKAASVLSFVARPRGN
jgi:hypothetical protein